MQTLELLSPGSNLESAKAAINYGADAVYIGAPKFSARKSASNTLLDIESLIVYAHLFHAKVYIALNTTLTDQEIEQAEKIILDCYHLGADAIIIQDLGLLQSNLPPIELFASTQMHNINWQKIEFLEKVGFKRVILPRELSLEEIKEIRTHSSIELEFFVHGSLCVSYSGQCYLSYLTKARSGNRGECAQPCRMLYSLTDNLNQTIIKDRYLLSLKDLNLSDYLNDLIEVGISSFKIEGRLKDINYVKNITAFYRKTLDKIIEGKVFKKSSTGKTTFHFTADPQRSFNRGFTDYFIQGRQKNICSDQTPKSIGRQTAKVIAVYPDHLLIDTMEKIANGDGLCFFDKDQILQGFNVNKVEDNMIYPNSRPEITANTLLYRNFDHHFNHSLEKDNSKRTIDIHFELTQTPEGICLGVKDEDGITAQTCVDITKTPALKKNQATENIRSALLKTGNTIFHPLKVDIQFETPLFIPSSVVNALRRLTLTKLEQQRLKQYNRSFRVYVANDYPYPEKQLNYLANVLNKKSENFYRRHGVLVVEPALEAHEKLPQGVVLMTTKHCLLNELGLCKKTTNKKPLNEPLFLIHNREKYKITFDCNRCVMKILY